MQSAPWIASIKWYLNLALAMVKHDSAKSTKDKHTKTLQQPMWLGITYVWLSIIACVLLFLCWLWIWLRIPPQSQPSSQVTLNSAIYQSQLNINKSVTNNSPMPSRTVETSAYPAIESVNKAMSQKPPSANNKKPMQHQWGLLSINKLEQVQANLQTTNLANSNDGCEDVSICTMHINSDVVIINGE